MEEVNGRPAPDEKLHRAFDALHAYVEREGFRGYDPYDGLTTPLPVARLGKWPAILFMQAMKRFPINTRPLLGIRKAHNPKAMGLLLHAYSLWYRAEPADAVRRVMDTLYEWLKTHPSEGYAGPAWGYHFDWAGKAKTVQAFVPTAVATGFVARGLYAYYEATGVAGARDLITGAAEFVSKDLPHDDSPRGLCISYTPLLQDHCYNASLLGAGVLAMAARLAGRQDYAEMARRAVRYVLQRQQPDGRWNYSLDVQTGQERAQIDFHQGYVLESLFEIAGFLQIENEVDDAVREGMAFYHKTQFFPDGRSLWRLPAVWPVEIHNQAQGIITHTRLAHLDESYLPFARRIAEWTVDHMQGADGHFYYRKYAWFTNRISYMRWSQAWMLLALATFLHRTRAGARQQRPATHES
jgi:hypothetical protein